MASVLPGGPPAYDPEHPEKTVKQICNYLWTLREGLDYELGQLRRELDEQKNREG